MKVTWKEGDRIQLLNLLTRRENSRGAYDYVLLNTKVKKRFNLTEAEIEKIGLVQNDGQVQYNPALESESEFELTEEEVGHIKGLIQKDIDAKATLEEITVAFYQKFMEAIPAE